MSVSPRYYLFKRSNGVYYILIDQDGHRSWRSTGAKLKSEALQALREFQEHRGVKHSRMDLGRTLTRPAVNQASLDKAHGLYRLYIEVQDTVEGFEPHGLIAIVVSGANIEDIIPKIERPIGRRLNNKSLLRPLPQNPSYYASLFEKRSR